jgi:hypothetical protein
VLIVVLLSAEPRLSLSKHVLLVLQVPLWHENHRSQRTGVARSAEGGGRSTPASGGCIAKRFRGSTHLRKQSLRRRKSTSQRDGATCSALVGPRGG